MSDTIPQSVSNGCRKYVKSRIIINTFNTFNNVAANEEGRTAEAFRMVLVIILWRSNTFGVGHLTPGNAQDVSLYFVLVLRSKSQSVILNIPPLLTET